MYKAKSEALCTILTGFLLGHGSTGCGGSAGGVEPLEDVNINNEYEHENDFKPYSYSKSFSQFSMLAMTPSSSL